MDHRLVIGDGKNKPSEVELKSLSIRVWNFCLHATEVLRIGHGLSVGWRRPPRRKGKGHRSRGDWRQRTFGVGGKFSRGGGVVCILPQSASASDKRSREWSVLSWHGQRWPTHWPRTDHPASQPASLHAPSLSRAGRFLIISQLNFKRPRAMLILVHILMRANVCGAVAGNRGQMGSVNCRTP